MLNYMEKQTNPYISILKQTDIFYDFSPSQLEMVANLCQEKNFDTGKIIFYEGADSDEIYIIVQGEVDILVNPALVSNHPEEERESVTIATLRRGQSFGEMALLDKGLRSATARAAKNNTRLLIIPSEKLMLICTSYPQLGYLLMRNLATDLSLKLRNTDLSIRERLLFGDGGR
jgi:CRP/FNR family cyclic AMP-dependent transcriptional regulator